MYLSQREKKSFFFLVTEEPKMKHVLERDFFFRLTASETQQTQTNAPEALSYAYISILVTRFLGKASLST